MSQKDKVFKIVQSAGLRGYKTWEVNKLGLQEYITDAGRQLRKLQNEGLVIGRKLESNKTKTWWTTVNMVRRFKSVITFR